MVNALALTLHVYLCQVGLRGLREIITEKLMKYQVFKDSAYSEHATFASETKGIVISLLPSLITRYWCAAKVSPIPQGEHSPPELRSHANLINDCMYVPTDITESITSLWNQEARHHIRFLWREQIVAYIYKGIPIQIGSIWDQLSGQPDTRPLLGFRRSTTNASPLFKKTQLSFALGWNILWSLLPPLPDSVRGEINESPSHRLIDWSALQCTAQSPEHN